MYALTLRILIVVAPQGSDFVLAADIPHSEADVLVLHSLHIETWTGSKTSRHLLHMYAFRTGKIVVLTVTPHLVPPITPDYFRFRTHHLKVV